jgi:hypothetical protein
VEGGGGGGGGEGGVGLKEGSGCAAAVIHIKLVNLSGAIAGATSSVADADWKGRQVPYCRMLTYADVY